MIIFLCMFFKFVYETARLKSSINWKRISRIFSYLSWINVVNELNNNEQLVRVWKKNRFYRIFDFLIFAVKLARFALFFIFYC